QTNVKEMRQAKKTLKRWLSSRINKLLQTATLSSLASSNQASSSKKQNTKGKPTSAPKADSESPPATFVKASLQVRLAKVVAGPCIEIKTIMPDCSAVTRASSIPRPMQVEITFDKTCEVTDAKITRSSTYPHFDSSVLTSL